MSLRHTQTSEATEQFQELKPKVDASAKVRRYRAGQVPTFATGYEEERGFVTAGNRVRTALQAPAQAKSTSASSSSGGRQRIEAQVIKAQPKAAPARDAKGSRRAHSSDESDAGNALDDSSSEDEEVDRRRQALRQKMLEKQSKQQSGSGDNASFETAAHRPVVEAKVVRAADEPKPQAAEPSSSDSSSSEYETDTDDSDEEQVLMKPVFVPKKARETIKRQEELEAEEEKRRLAEEAKANARKAEARKLVVEELQREKEATHAGDATDTEMPDDTDGLDPEQEYRDWELREMRRIKRDRDRREQRRLEAEETLRRRNMTDEERQAEDEKLKKNQPKEKAKLKFLQKYYHKGAFYMDEGSIRDKADVRLREASGATLEDKFNKDVLPAVLQVKNFGKAGRTKYTHLAAEDTSRKDSFWGRNDAVREKFSSRLSGTRELDAPSKKRKTDP